MPRRRDAWTLRIGRSLPGRLTGLAADRRKLAAKGSLAGAEQGFLAKSRKSPVKYAARPSGILPKFLQEGGQKVGVFADAVPNAIIAKIILLQIIIASFGLLSRRRLDGRDTICRANGQNSRAKHSFFTIFSQQFT